MSHHTGTLAEDNMNRDRLKRMSARSREASVSRATRRGILLRIASVLAVVSVAMAGMALAASSNSEQRQVEQGQVKEKRYKATRAFVVDKATGTVRMPTQQEVDEVVATLSALGQRPAEDLSQATQTNGALTLDLGGGYNGIFLAQPRAGGGWETKCVFTIEEGAEFVELVDDD